MELSTEHICELTKRNSSNLSTTLPLEISLRTRDRTTCLESGLSSECFILSKCVNLMFSSLLGWLCVLSSFMGITLVFLQNQLIDGI